jgi:choline dehydrogenase
MAVSRAFVEATAARCGVPVTGDFNGAEQLGAGLFHVTCAGGQRCSTAVAFLDPVRERLTVITGATALRVEVENGRAVGVRYRDRRGEAVVRARREVILSAGAIGSPQLLMLSGIGPADALRAQGITPVVDLPEVGKNLQDHVMVGMIYRARNSLSVSTLRALGWMVRWTLTRRGPFASNLVEAGAFLPGGLQLHFIPFGTEHPNADEPYDPTPGSFFSIYPTLLYPQSRGEIRLRSADPTAAPAIDPRYLAEEADVRTLVDGMTLSREIAAAAPLASFRGDEVFPADDLRADLRRRLSTTFHPVGTCAMGTVVDAQLRVRGVDGLRVADASVMPRIVGGNTNAPTIMIAEKAADLMTEKA